MPLLYHEILGNADSAIPLCIVPGLGNDLQVWTPFARKLQAARPGLPVLLLDNLGAGRSEAPPPPYSIEQMAAMVLDILDHLKLPCVRLLGHSMGGFIAQHLAINNPDRVAGLLLCSTAARLSRRNILLFGHFLQGLFSGVSPAWVTRELFFWTLPPQQFEKPGADVLLERLVHETMSNPYLQSMDGLRGQISAISDFDATKRLGSITAPTFVLQGSADQLILPAEAAALAGGIPGARFEILESRGHLPHIEAPQELLELALGFFDPA